jgi:hypothetical protein
MIKWNEKISAVYFDTCNIILILSNKEYAEMAYNELSSWELVVMGIYKSDNGVDFYFFSEQGPRMSDPRFFIKEYMPDFELFASINVENSFSPFYIKVKFLSNQIQGIVSDLSLDVVCNGLWVLHDKA